MQIVTDKEDSPHLTVNKIKGELYYAFAEHDQCVPENVIPDLKAALNKADVKATVEVFPGTHHGFCFPERAVYDTQASEIDLGEDLRAVGSASEIAEALVMLEEVAGTQVFNGERSREGYRLNRMAMSLTEAANRAAFVADETGYARGMGLDDAEIDMVRRRDWKAMIDAGGSIYLLIKIAGALGVPLYAGRRADRRA